jgi:SSS family solute:Na+ symporter
MLTTSLSKDLYKTFVNPTADDARLLQVGRWTAVGAGLAGVVLAMALSSVAGALKAFYGVLTVALTVPFLMGLYTRRPTAGHARVGVVAAVAVSAAVQLLAGGGPHAAWLPYAAGIGAATLVFATAWLKPPR